jgi:Mn-dependent DtxR family transcriptional regulator
MADRVIEILRRNRWAMTTSEVGIALGVPQPRAAMTLAALHRDGLVLKSASPWPKWRLRG